MTLAKDLFAKFPRRIKNRSEKPSATFELVEDKYAMHRPGSEPEIVRDEDMAGPGSRSRVGPVYRLQPAGGEAVPTGRVLLRFKTGVSATDREQEIKHAGYEIAETLSYAPEAAWLQSRTGDIADALNGISKLEELADVENVEPQMLMQRTSR